MGKVLSAISMSLDGYVTGPNPTHEQQLGEGGGVLFRWLGDEGTPDNRRVLDEMVDAAGAVVMGRIGYDLARWTDGGPVGKVPCFVVTHKAPADQSMHPPGLFTFVTDGVASAIAQAKAVAGDKLVGIHGASIARQCLALGLLDEIQIHLAPVLLNGGTRLFEHLGGQIQLENKRVVATPTTTHLLFAVVKEDA
jgi:dihydrofolate reductase